jgi:DNA replication and repair protein RecF
LILSFPIYYFILLTVKPKNIMILQKLNLINFRSYRELSISFPPEGALFEGLNGAGKTNLLESIHLLCTGRSQRGAARGDMISHGEDSAYVEGEFLETIGGYRDDIAMPIIGDDANPTSAIGINPTNIIDISPFIAAEPSPPYSSQPISHNFRIVSAALGFSRDKRVVMKRDGVEVGSFSEWFGERPVVSFGTDDLELVYGAPEARRKFLDMLICQMDRGYLDALASYRKNMACRNALFGRTDDGTLFEVYERAMAVAASTLVFRREEVVKELRECQANFYAEISGGRESAGLEYVPKIKQKNDNFYDVLEWQNVYLNTLAESRKRDAELMFTAHGPHRDDLRFLLGGRPAKSYASQGQCRSFALSLKLGSALLLERSRGCGMIFLIDDAVSELDAERTERVYPLLEGRGQIFIATPRCHATLSGKVLRCVVEPGKVVI